MLCVCVRAQLCPTLKTSWTVAHQAPLSMGFPRQEYWSGYHFKKVILRVSTIYNEILFANK